MSMTHCRLIRINPLRQGPRPKTILHLAVFAPENLSNTLAALGILTLVSCMTPNAHEPSSSTERWLIGKARSQIVTCAGSPKRETTGERGVNLTYQREARLLERRSVQSRGSLALSHPICQADLYLKDDRVIEAQFTTIPPESGSYDLCEAIFEPCEHK
jgi:hypothetical protein